MDITVIRKTYRSVEISLSQKRIKDALDILHKVAKETQNSLLIDEIYTVEQSYKNMLKFLVDGFNDPDKSQPYNHLIINILNLTDNIFSELTTQYYRGYTSDILNKPISDSSIDDLMSTLDREEREDTEPFILLREESFSALFNTVAFTAMPSQTTSSTVESIFYKTGFSEYEKLNLIAAYLLSLNNYFDERKIHTLLKLTDSQNIKLSGRALVVLILALIKYDKRLHLYPTIINSLKNISTSEKKQKEVKWILFQLLNTKEAEKVSQKFSNEILPEMIKMNPLIKKKLDLDNILSDNPLEDAIPDWEEIVNDSPELINKIDEINKMQEEGLDLMSSTFKMLKHFSFFEIIRNWFLPFYTNQSYVTAAAEMAGRDKMMPFLKFIEKVPTICDSDKYSMAFAMGQMPILQKDLHTKMGQGSSRENMEAMSNEIHLNPEKSLKYHTNLFIQDLYRFFTAFPNKNDFENIFDLSFDVYGNDFFNLIFPDNSIIKVFGQYYFDKQYFDKASNALALYNSKNEPEADVLQKLGFCYQQQNDHKTALQYYLMADFFEQNRHWNLKKIALCYRNTNEPKKALEYYLLAEAIQPDNLHTQAAIGQCHLELQNYEEALKYYFKVEFLDPKNKKVWKPIAWCCYVLGKFDLSEKYYLKLLEKENHFLDTMSYGHLLWAMGKKREAIAQYKLSSTAPDSSLKIFIENFVLEVEYLKKHKIDEIEIATFLDQLRYSLEE